ncbi:MAG TPA: hypothetical protein VKY19_27880 [Ktedonosporobacter sp.]|jgi:hypothetical protein|nr:hypothetical protein [Ktedonosporobacter sp.]
MSRFPFASLWRYAWLICLLFGMLMLASCGQNTLTGQTSVRVGGTSAPVCDIEVSWAKFYGSITELKQATGLDLVVQGTFTAVQGNASSGARNTPLMTNFSFTISKMLLDTHHLSNRSSSITIRQTGGNIGGTVHQVCGDPLFHVGEKAILFLHRSDAGQYFVVGGPSGRFEVHDGLVQPVNDEGVRLPAGLTEQQFYALLQAA